MPLDDCMIPVPPGREGLSCAELVERLGQAATPDPALSAGLPETPGVYRFYDANDVLLYVGKSRSIRQRVRAHFSARRRHYKELKMALQTRRIEYDETAGEVGALLLENRLIKALQPLFNARQRKIRPLVTLQFETGDDGFDIPAVSREPLLTRRWNRDCYGLYRNRTNAMRHLSALAAEHGLCRKKLGLEHGPGPCFNYQLQRCRGACTGCESPAEHGQRLRAALETGAIEAWPFAGPLLLEERSGDGRNSDWHLVHHWSHLGTAPSEVAARALVDAPEPDFDIDTYRILLRALRGRTLRLKPL